MKFESTLEFRQVLLPSPKAMHRANQVGSPLDQTSVQWENLVQDSLQVAVVPVPQYCRIRGVISGVKSRDKSLEIPACWISSPT